MCHDMYIYVVTLGDCDTCDVIDVLDDCDVCHGLCICNVSEVCECVHDDHHDCHVRDRLYCKRYISDVHYSFGQR
jgi:hypothetical protein